MNAEELRGHLSAGEGLMVEFKRYGSGPQNDLYETICSFANRQGGNIFMGVDDDGAVVGIPSGAVHNMQRMVVNAVSNPSCFPFLRLLKLNLLRSMGHG